MTTLPPPSVEVLPPPQIRQELSGSLLAAHRLRSLASTLVISWETLDAESRSEMVQRIQWVADELASAERLSTAARGDVLRYLTAREFQVLSAIADGASTSDIASRLGLSTSTVRSYVKAILSKLGVHSRLEAVTMLLARESRRTWRAGDSRERRSG